MYGAPELLWKPQAAAESQAHLPSSFDLKGRKDREGKDAPIGKTALNCSEANRVRLCGLPGQGDKVWPRMNQGAWILSFRP